MCGDTNLIRLGGISVDQVFEMELALPLCDVVPGVEAEDLGELKQWYWDDFLSPEISTAGCALSMHTYLVRIDDKIILIDTCNGNHKDRSLPFLHQLNTSWLRRLRERGVAPEDVDMVIFTHLHADHVGWNTRLEGERWVPVFPNARHVMIGRELDYFRSDAATPLDKESYQDSVLPVIVAGLADIVTDDAVLYGALGNGIWMRPAPGHTPGSCTIRACRNGPLAVFSGDILHHPIQLVRPDLATAFDVDGSEAVIARNALISEVVDTEAVIFPAHFLKGGAGRIRSEAGRCRFEFLSL